METIPLRHFNKRRVFSICHSITTGREPIEEETTLRYDASRYYPVRIGQTFCERYKVAVKLGYGGYSTVWLCEDQAENSFKTIKVGTRTEVEGREVKVLNYLKNINSSHGGRYCVRRSCDSFQIETSDGYHQCLVYEPLGISMLEYVSRQHGNTLNAESAKWVLTYLLTAVDYLHTSSVVHTDIKLDNIQTTLPYNERAVLTSFVNAESEEPSPRKIVDDTRTIYTSRTLQYEDGLTFPILSDLGMSVFGQKEYEGIVQSIPYRAPEVILRRKWSSSVDIWNVGVSTWELCFSERLFGEDNERNSLAMMIAYLGHPPPELIAGSSVKSEYFDGCGRWKGYQIQPISLEDRLEGGTNVGVFLDFIRAMLDWVPERRKTAAELLSHPWLKPNDLEKQA